MRQRLRVPMESSQRSTFQPPDTVHIPTFRTFPNDRISTWVLRMLQLGALAAILARSAYGQDSLVVLRPGTAVGVAAGLPGIGSHTSFELTTVGVSVTRVEPLRLGYDISVGTMPRAFASGAATLGGRFGVVLPIPVTRQLIALPGAGASVIGITDFEGGAGGTAGWNLNLSLLAAMTPSAAVRTGVSMHQFSDFGSSIWLYEFGIAWMH